MKDCHVHSTYTDSSYPEVKDYINACKSKGIDEITITDLFEYCNDKYSLVFAWYKLTTTRAAKDDIVKVNLGLEVGMRPDTKSEIQRFTKDRGLDYIVGTTSVIGNQSIYDDRFYEGISREDAYRKYFEYVLNNVDTYKDVVDTYGKLDQIMRCGPNPDLRIEYDDYKDLLDEILKIIAENRKGIEVSTLPFRSGGIVPFPSMKILRRFKDLGGEIVTLGSCSTSVDTLGRDYDFTYDILEGVGFDTIATYHKREPEFQKIKELRR